MKKIGKVMLLAFSLMAIVFSACKTSTPTEDPVPAEEPKILKQPKSAEYYVGDVAEPLVVEATISDDGELSYYWYESETGKVVHEGSSYVPSTNAQGTYSYYCVVENYNCTCPSEIDTAEVKSEVAVIKILPKVIDPEDEPDEIQASVPVITITMGNGEYEVGTENAFVKVTATVEDEKGKGAISYQWYTIEGGNPKIITGQTSSTCKVDTSAAGDYSYYCVVTNTFNGQQKSKNSDEISIKTPESVTVAVTFSSSASSFCS